MMVMYQFINSYTLPPTTATGPVSGGVLPVASLPPGLDVSGDPFVIFVVDPDGVSRGEVMLVTPPLTGTGNLNWPVTPVFGDANPGSAQVHAAGDYVYFPASKELYDALRAWANLTGKPTTFAPIDHAPEHELGGGDVMLLENMATAETDTTLVPHPDGTGGMAWGADLGSGGGGSYPIAIYKSSSTDLAITTSTTRTEINSALRLTVAASVGDVLEFAINGYMSYGNRSIHFDAATVVSGALTNYFSPASSVVGAPGWYKSLTGTSQINQVTPPLQGSTFYTVQSGDISGGNVTVTLVACNESSGGTAGNLLRSNGLTLFLKNHRQ